MTEDDEIGLVYSTSTKSLHVPGWQPEQSPSIKERIATLLADADAFEDNEPPPSASAVETMNAIIRDVDACFIGGEISAWYGELSITWRYDNRILRLSVFSDGREPLLYFQTDNGESLTRGHSIRPATSEVLRDRLHWLLDGCRDYALAAG